VSLRVVNPATGELLREMAEDGPEAVARRFTRAVDGQRAWSKVPLEERRAAVRRFGEAVTARRGELAHLLTTEMGKPITQSRNELMALQGRLDFFMDNVERVLAEETVYEDVRGGLREVIAQEPLGVIANVSAWNYPYFVGANVFVPALLTGNAVLYKPSEFATLTGLAIAEALHEAGVPRDVFAPVVGGGAVGRSVLDQPLAAVFFTGSHATGRAVAEAAARRLMRVQLELGGKDPAYVCEDVDVEKAAHAVAEGAFYNTGQSCCAVERVYVHQDIHDRFLDVFHGVTRGLAVGDPLDESTYIGPVTRPAQLAVLEAQVEDAVAKGARLMLGGRRLDRPGFYFAPTVLAGADHSMSVMRDETFGPVIGVQKVRDDAEALALMNDTSYGLTAAVYTADGDRARRLLAEVNAGSAYWNCCDRVSPRLPWSGRGHSGMGSTLGLAGIRTFLQPKAYHLKGDG
jgi:acyl-CoA reductase-like NAD-dependent aldehyde dehydrogenase